MLSNDVSEVVVSVLVVSYNQENYIEKAIRSILSSETEYCYEILAGDDASLDRTKDIIIALSKEYPDKVIPVIRKTNVGAAWNGFDLLKRARGKYVAFCDGDDCWCDKKRIQAQVDFLKAHPEYGGICGRVRLIDHDGKNLSDDFMERKSFFLFDAQVFTWNDFGKWLMPGHNSAMMIRHNKIILEKMEKVFLAHPTVGDRSGLLYGLLEGDIYCTKNTVSCYRILNSSDHFMTQYVEKNLRDQDVRMMQAIEEFAKSEFSINLNFDIIKKERFIAAIDAWMKKRTKRNRQVVWTIFMESKQRLSYLRLLLKTIFFKTYYRFVLHEDRRIEF